MNSDARKHSIFSKLMIGTLAEKVDFLVRRVQIVTLAARQRVPTIYIAREFVEVGGLMSCGASPIRSGRLVSMRAASKARNQPTFRSSRRPGSRSGLRRT